MAMDKKSAPTSLYRDRRSFAKIPDVMDVPNLIAIQTESFDWFKNEGLAQAFADVCPIENNTGDMCVEFGKHEFGEPKYTVDECKEKDVSYQAPLFVEIRFINRETGEIKEQDVFMGDFPLMTPRGTFIINGTERVVVSQLVRSPGVYFASERDKTSDKTVYNAKVIPSRGAWLEFETDKRDILSVRIDRKRKQPATLLVRALGLAETREDIIELLGSDEMVLRTLDRDPATTKEESLIELYKRFRPGEPPTIDSARTLLEGLFFNPQRYDLAKVGRYKINKKLGFDPDYEASTLTDDDIVRTMTVSVAGGNSREVTLTQFAAGSGGDTKGIYTSMSQFIPASTSTTDRYYPSNSTIDGQPATGFKLGTSSLAGVFTSEALGASLTGDKKLSFYAVAWTGKAATVYIRVNNGGAVSGDGSHAITASAGATGSGNDFTFTDVTDSDYYTFQLTGLTAASTVTISTSPDFTAASDRNTGRAIVLGVQVY